MQALHELTLAALSAALATGEISSEEATNHALRLIERLDGRERLNAFLHVAASTALAEARAADARRASGTRKGPLDGIPIALKDLVDTEDMPTTAGSRVFAGRTPNREATIVRQLRDAGAVILGKTNMMEFAYGHPHPDVGETANPWDTTRTAGGSSGGSAAAIAAGLAWGAIGSDTGGSIRSPAAYCGVTGLKPTYGLVSCSGVIPLSWSLDHVGPLARTAEDCALILSVIAGHDAADPSSAPRHLVDRVVADVAGLSGGAPSCEGLRVGIVPQMFDLAVTPGLRETANEALSALQRCGMDLVELHLDREIIDSFLPAISRIYPAEAAAYHRSVTRDRWADLGPVLRAGLEDALQLSAADYVDAQRMRIEIGYAFHKLYQRVDLLVWPAQPLVAPKLGTTDSVVQGAADDHATTIEVEIAATAPANLLGEPGISIPCGFAEGLPIGLHLQGPTFSDALVLRAAMAFQAETGLPSLPSLD